LFYQKTKKLNLGTANIILINNNYRFIIYNYLDGKKIQSPSNSDVRQCAEFIIKLQKINKFDKKSKLNNLSYATDYLSSIDNYKKNLKYRINNIIKNCDTKFKKRINNFLFKFNITLKKIHKFENYNFKKNEFIFSPSDFTFKNIIKSKKKLYFFDFEYSGFDHPYKLISDFISQPNIELNKTQSKLFIKILENKIKINVKQDLFFKVLFITKLKWILIMLNCYKKNKKNIPENLILRNKNLQLVSKKLKILELEYKNL
jgi:phage-related protein